ncbi:MAG: amino acid permease [Planctomycetaceae bacterium]|nr:amino acid permease [Planctomycetaceae bacterium]
MTHRASHPAGEQPQQLPAVLGLVAAVAIVVGEVIGSGIFLKPNQIALATDGYVGLILSLWAICGLISLCGALTLAELAAMMPHAGGTYIFLRDAYGKIWGFLWCWAEFWVIRSGAIAALATAVGLSVANLLHNAGTELSPAAASNVEKGIAVGCIVLLAAINIIGTRWGGAVQVATTAVKAGFLIFLAVLPFLAAGRQPLDLHPLFPATIQKSLWAGIGSAIAGIMWAYDGWGQVTVVAEEIKNPQRNLPLALGGGVLFLIVLYTGANLGYHLTLPSSEIAAAKIPAEAVSRALLGDFGARLVLSMLLVSAFGALNSNILVGPRVLFAVARDNVVLSPLADRPALQHPGPGHRGVESLVGRAGAAGQPDAAARQTALRRADRLRDLRGLDVLLRGRGGGLRLPLPAARRSAPLPHLGVSGGAAGVSGGLRLHHRQHVPGGADRVPDGPVVDRSGFAILLADDAARAVRFPVGGQPLDRAQSPRRAATTS